MRPFPFLAPLVCALALGGCNPEQLPNGAALSIQPSESKITVTENLDGNGDCRIDPAYHVDVPFVIALRDGQGSPIGEAELSVHTTFSANFFAGYPVLELYEDRNGNGVVDAETELVSDTDDGIARVKTSRYGGEHVVLVRQNLSCAYRGHLHAYIDGVATSVPVEVVADGEEEPEEDVEEEEDENEDEDEATEDDE